MTLVHGKGIQVLWVAQSPRPPKDRLVIGPLHTHCPSHSPTQSTEATDRGLQYLFPGWGHRANEQVALIAWHTCASREQLGSHGAVALNPHWDVDTLNDAAKKTVTLSCDASPTALAPRVLVHLHEQAGDSRGLQAQCELFCHCSPQMWPHTD